MISHKYKFILITPQKTASTSLSQALLKSADIDEVVVQGGSTFDYFDEFKDQSGKPRMSKHLDIGSIRRYFDDREVDIDDYVVYSSIRNPYTRLTSYWSGGKNIFGPFQQEGLVRKLSSRLPPLVNFLKYKGEIVVDDFIRFENLQGDFDAFCKRVGLAPQQLPHRYPAPITKKNTRGKSKNGYYASLYNKKTANLVRELYAEDFDYFGHIYNEGKLGLGF